MEVNNDEFVSLWVEGIPYVWIDNKLLGECARFYIVSKKFASFTKNNLLIDRNIYSPKDFEYTLLPLANCAHAKKEGINPVKFFMVYGYEIKNHEDPLPEIKQNIKDAFEIRIQGKKIRKIPKAMDTPSVIHITNKSDGSHAIKPYSQYYRLFPSSFGNPHSVDTKWGVYAPIKWEGQGKRATYHNIYEVITVFFKNMRKEDINRRLTSIHYNALLNAKKKLVEKSKIDDHIFVDKAYSENEYVKNINKIDEYIEETDKISNKEDYGWTYLINYNYGIHIEDAHANFELATNKRKSYKIYK